MTIDMGLVSVQILEKTYQFKCPKDKIAELHKAASLINTSTDEISKQNPLKSIERTIIMAAMNIAHDFLELQKKETEVYKNINSKIKVINNKIKDYNINNTFEKSVS